MTSEELNSYTQRLATQEWGESTFVLTESPPVLLSACMVAGAEQLYFYLRTPGSNLFLKFYLLLCITYVW